MNSSNSSRINAAAPDDEGDAEFDRLIAEFLAAENDGATGGATGDLAPWLARAGERAGEFQLFVDYHQRMRRVTRDQQPDSPVAGNSSAVPLPSAGPPVGLRAASTDNSTSSSTGALPDVSTAGSLSSDATQAWTVGGSPVRLVRDPRGSSTPDRGEPAGDVGAGDDREGDDQGGRRRFGDYELLGELARGGMGVVFRARHRGLRRVVALKMILAGEFASPEDLARFRLEASSAAHLDHPGIVPIFEFGQIEGQHFYTMALIDGPSLSSLLDAGPVDERRAAMIVRKVAEAVAYAHGKGVIHRDLKPANILLARVDASTTAQTSPSDRLPFEPKVTDFGLAKRDTGDRGLTATGTAVGTPSYMSPEQAAGRVSEVGPASDVYSLGAILYELLTGRPPFRAANSVETLMQVVENMPAPPRLLNPAIDVDLETICLKCLEKSPSLRYASAQSLADDLRRYLDGDPIEARSVNLVSRVTLALRKRRHEEEFRGWGRAVFLAGIIVLAAHGAIFALHSIGYGPLLAHWLPRVMMVLLLFATLYYNRPHSIWPTNAAERLIWVVWGGFFLGLLAINVILASLRLPAHLSYAFSMLLGGLCFFVLGSHLWGGCYVIGLAFLAAAPLLAHAPDVAPLIDGLMWFAAITSVGVHYWPQRASKVA